jgi:single-strand DNA-binding protein
MMASLNKCLFIGNLTKEPEIKYMSNGDAVANCSIACNETWKDKSGNKQERVEYVNLVFYRKLAEIVGEWCHKGQSIYVSGKMVTRKWQDKSGNDRYTTEIVCDELQMLGGKQGASNSESKPAKQSESSSSSWDDIESDIPF